MIRNLFIAGTIISCLLLNGCGTLYLNAPEDPSIKIMSKYKPVEVRIEKKSGSNGGEPNRLMIRKQQLSLHKII